MSLDLQLPTPWLGTAKCPICQVVIEDVTFTTSYFDPLEHYDYRSFKYLPTPPPLKTETKAELVPCKHEIPAELLVDMIEDVMHERTVYENLAGGLPGVQSTVDETLDEVKRLIKESKS